MIGLKLERILLNVRVDHKVGLFGRGGLSRSYMRSTAGSTVPLACGLVVGIRDSRGWARPA